MITMSKMMTKGYLGEMTPEQNDYLERLVRKGEYLLSLSLEYLDLARLEGGGMRYEPAPGIKLMDDIVVPAIEIIQSQATQKGMKIRLPDRGAPTEIECDPDLIKIVMVNFLSNAVKYGYEDKVIQVEIDFYPIYPCKIGQFRASQRSGATNLDMSHHLECMPPR